MREKPSPLVAFLRENSITAVEAPDSKTNHWIDMGEAVIEALSMIRRADREEAVRVFSAHFHSYPTHIRQCVAAVTFLRKDDVAELAADLRLQPVAVVDCLASWFEHDPQTALQRAREVIGGGWSFRKLRDAARQARRDSLNTPEAVAERFRRRALETLQVGPATGFVEFDPGPPLHHLPVDFWIEKRARKIAIRVIGPFASRTETARGMWVNLAAAFGVSALGFEAWLAVPADTIGSRYRDAITELAPGSRAPVQVFDIVPRDVSEITKPRIRSR